MSILRCLVRQTQVFKVEVPLTAEESKDGAQTKPELLLALINQDIASWDFQDCIDDVVEDTWEISDE